MIDEKSEQEGDEFNDKLSPEEIQKLEDNDVMLVNSLNKIQQELDIVDQQIRKVQMKILSIKVNYHILILSWLKFKE